MSEAYIVGAVRTATGRRKGALAGWHPADLGAASIDAVLERTGIDPAAVDDVIFGCVTQAGEQSLALARNVVLASNLPDTVPGITIDRQCGSAQQAVHFAAQAVMSGTQDLVIAGGVESMTRVPMRTNMTLHQQAGIGGLPWSERILSRYGVAEFSQFTGAEMIAEKYGFSREEMDAFGLESHRRAIAATASGAFDAEIVPLDIETECGPAVHARDEGIRTDATLESMATVKPILEGGRLTAATASQIADGSAALLIANERAVKARGLTPLARVHHLTVTGGDPVIMLEEPIRATRLALERSGMALADIDLFEVNEAFASVPMAWLKALGADPERLNVNGGSIATGHPLGGTGAKLMTTLVHALRASGLRYGLQTMCEGGGMANVTIIEAL
ncbi:MAG: acetyl-CoA C-acyltransferase [Alphaproteobacteria bacterium]|nr:acetyl-CoA C-acyltransferase [Alphaproteobacteria bacterium]